MRGCVCGRLVFKLNRVGEIVRVVDEAIKSHLPRRDNVGHRVRARAERPNDVVRVARADDFAGRALATLFVEAQFFEDADCVEDGVVLRQPVLDSLFYDVGEIRILAPFFHELGAEVALVRLRVVVKKILRRVVGPFVETDDGGRGDVFAGEVGCESLQAAFEQPFAEREE